MKRSTSLVSRQYLVPFVLITSLFFLWGFARAILDVLNKHFQDSLNIGITESSMIQVTTYLCYFFMAIPSGIFISRYGYRRGVVFGLLLFAVGSFLFIPASNVGALWAFLGALAVIGCGLTFLETAANPYSTELGPRETATSRLNLSQTFNGLGSALAPVIVGGFLFSGGGEIYLPYTVMGIVVMLVAVIFSFVRLPEISHSDEPESSLETEEGRWRGYCRLFSNSYFILGLLALLSYEVSEISINSYFMNFTTGLGWLSKQEASYILGLALFIFMVGRFVGSWIMRYLRAELMLLICAVGSMVSMAVVFVGVKEVSIAAVIANYAFEAIMFPTIFSLALRGLGSLTKSASSILMMTPIGGCGFLLVSIMAEQSLMLPFFIPLAGFFVVFVFALHATLHSQKME